MCAVQPPGNCEFYAGDAARIGAACRAGKWMELREGLHSVKHVVFPDFIHCLDVHLLDQVVAEVTGRPEVTWAEPGRLLAGDQELWAAEVAPQEWVAAAARVEAQKTTDFRRKWMAHGAEYEPDPQAIEAEWMSPELLSACDAFLDMIRTAHAESLDVVEIWVH